MSEKTIPLLVPDWTCANGRANSSEQYHEAVALVARLIRESAFDLIGGRAECVAGLIVAQLATCDLRFRPSTSEEVAQFREYELEIERQWSEMREAAKRPANGR